MGDRQTPYGFATWVVSMDEPDSVWRPKVTLQQIIDEAKLALENARPAEAELDSLRSQLGEEVERLRQKADSIGLYSQAVRLSKLLSEGES